jgi:hypothetical protein
MSSSLVAGVTMSGLPLLGYARGDEWVVGTTGSPRTDGSTGGLATFKGAR